MRDKSSVAHRNDVPNILFDAWLPLQCYQLKIRHKLLMQLGRFSHFIISFLGRRNGDLDGITAVTSISATQLAPVIERLRGLKILRDASLTEAGQRYALMIETLHERAALLWLDTNYEQPLAVVRHAHPSIAPIPDDDLTIGARSNAGPRPAKERRYDLGRQLARLTRADDQCAWLPFLFPSFASLPDPQDNWWREWELDMYAADLGETPQGMRLELSTADEQACEKPALELENEVIALHTQYAVPNGMPSALVQQAPAKSTLYYDYVDERIGDMRPPSGDGTCYRIYLPDHGMSSEARAVQALFREQALRAPRSEELDMLDRKHALVPLLRRREFPWSAIRAAMAKTDGVWMAAQL